MVHCALKLKMTARVHAIITADLLSSALRQLKRNLHLNVATAVHSFWFKGLPKDPREPLPQSLMKPWFGSGNPEFDRACTQVPTSKGMRII